MLVNLRGSEHRNLGILSLDQRLDFGTTSKLVHVVAALAMARQALSSVEEHCFCFEESTALRQSQESLQFLNR
jgi:hypothetical protein